MTEVKVPISCCVALQFSNFLHINPTDNSHPPPLAANALKVFHPREPGSQAEEWQHTAVFRIAHTSGRSNTKLMNSSSMKLQVMNYISCISDIIYDANLMKKILALYKTLSKIHEICMLVIH